jgi:transposase
MKMARNSDVMTVGRRKEIVRHLSENDLDRLLDETDDDKTSKRLTFVKRLYKGATLEDAADDVGKSSATGTRWARRWNEGGLGQLTPNFGGGRPPKLDETEQDDLVELLRDGQPWKSQEVQHLLMDEFNVEYHPNYLGTFLQDLGLSYAKPRPKRPYQPENPDAILEERVGVISVTSECSGGMSRSNRRQSSRDDSTGEMSR